MTKHSFAGLGISLVVIAAFCTLSYRLWDQSLSGAIHALPSLWIHLGEHISVYGRAEWYWAAGLLVAVASWLFRRNHRLVYLALYFCLSLALSNILSTVLKLVLGRCRPCLFFQSGLYGFLWLRTRAAETGFPSGHCATVAAAVAAIWFVHPPLRAVCVLWMTAMISARLLAEAHYLSDCVAGTYVGIVAAWIALPMARKWLSGGEQYVKLTEPL